MLHSVRNSALSDVYSDMPFGSQVVPMPESPDVDNTNLARSFKGQRGKILLRGSVVVSGCRRTRAAS